MSALVVGYLGYQTYTYKYAYTEQTVLLRRLYFNLLNAPQWRYGTITAIDQVNSTLQVQLAHELPIRVIVPANAYIGRQDLINEQGVYTGALAPTQGTFNDLQVGQHFAGTIVRDLQGSFVAPTILVGNPL